MLTVLCENPPIHEGSFKAPPGLLWGSTRTPQGLLLARLKITACICFQINSILRMRTRILSPVKSLEELPPHFLAQANLFTRFLAFVCFCPHYNYHGLELRFNVYEDKIKVSIRICLVKGQINRAWSAQLKPWIILLVINHMMCWLLHLFSCSQDSNNCLVAHLVRV